MQILVNGLITGLTLALLALSFNLVYLPARVFNVALGGLYAIVPYFAWAFIQRGFPWYIAVSVASLAGIGLSLIFELINHAPLEQKRASSGAHLVSSLGIYIIIVQLISIFWGNEAQVLRTGSDTVVRMGSVDVTHAQITIVFVSAGMLSLFYIWLKFSSLGLFFRGLSVNPTEFALRGYSVRGFRLLAFGLSGLFCSACALLVSYDTGFDPHGGLAAILLAIVAVIIGGKRSFLGPLLGGLLLGVVRSGTVWILSAFWQDAITFLILAIFLFIRPQGLLGKENRLETQVE